jgi:hypothetical protein
MLRWSFPIVAAAIGLSACLTPMRFGAESFERTADRNGVPTYHASGHLDHGQSGEAKALEVMQAACPDGNPAFIDGYAMKLSIVPRWTWNATFTCDNEIPGV